MKNSIYTSLVATALAAFLSACGGGGTGAGAGAGSVTGDIASIAGTYTVTVSLSDCDAGDNDATTTYESVSAGVCKITTTSAGTSRVETRKDLLAAGTYQLVIGTDGSLSIGGLKRLCTGTCIVAGPPANTVYTIGDGGLVGGNAAVSISLLTINATANPKTVVGLFYGNSSQITGTTLGAAESGVVVVAD